MVLDKDTSKQPQVDIVRRDSQSSSESQDHPDLGLAQITSAHGNVININSGYTDPVLERKILRKLDFIILPLTAIMYLFNALDKANISNAKTDGIDTDLGISGDQWNLLLSIFYIPFVLFAFPLSLVIKRFNAANVIPMLMFGFGSITGLLTISALYPKDSNKGFASIMTGRFFLGIFESAFFPGIIYYLSTFYRRTELASRIAIFYSAANIANAFSGLFSFGVFQINSPHLHGWQILFLLEMAGTLIFAVIAFLFLPRDIDSFTMLTEEEKAYGKYRIETDSSAVSGSKTSIKDAVKVFEHPIYAVWMCVEICIGVPLNSINNWFPQIVGSLGKSTVQTNLYTVAPNIWGAVALLALAFSSDYCKIRSTFICIAVLSSLIGFAVFGAIDTQSHIGVAYFACFLMTTGSSASSVLTSTWYNNNTPNENRRVIISAIGVPLANAAGLISTNIFRAKDAPKYVPALGITAGFGGLAIILVLGIYTFMVFDNRRRNKEQGVQITFADIPTSELAEGPKNPNFRWMY